MEQRRRKKIKGAAAALMVLLLAAAAGAEVGEMAKTNDKALITIVFDNKSAVKGFKTGWGFAAVVDKGGHRLLFDTGCSGRDLVYNLKNAGIGAKSIDTIILSHSHWDHTGGLFDFLKENKDVTVWVPASFSKRFKQQIRDYGAKVREVTGYAKIANGLYTTGELGTAIKEQSLIIDTEEGPAVLTGCAHPGIVNIVKSAGALRRQKITGIIGGFHLADRTAGQMKAIIASLKALGVKNAVPMHCTGQKQIKLIIKEFGSGAEKTGAGLKINL